MIPGSSCRRKYDLQEDCKNMPLVAMNYYGPRKYRYPMKRSISFLTTQELFSYKAIPALGVCAYLGSAIGAMAHRETFEILLGSEYTTIRMINTMMLTSVAGTACYIYGRRHIRHAGAFQKMIYPVFGSLFFNCASQFGWAYIKIMLKESGYHWRVAGGILSGLLFLQVGRSYIEFIDRW